MCDYDAGGTGKATVVVVFATLVTMAWEIALIDHIHVFVCKNVIIIIPSDRIIVVKSTEILKEANHNHLIWWKISTSWNWVGIPGSHKIDECFIDARQVDKMLMGHLYQDVVVDYSLKS